MNYKALDKYRNEDTTHLKSLLVKPVRLSSLKFKDVKMIALFQKQQLSSKPKDIGGWQFLTIEAAETVSGLLTTRVTYFLKKYLGNRLLKKSHFISV